MGRSLPRTMTRQHRASRATRACNTNNTSTSTTSTSTSSTSSIAFNPTQPSPLPMAECLVAFHMPTPLLHRTTSLPAPSLCSVRMCGSLHMLFFFFLCLSVCLFVCLSGAQLLRSQQPLPPLQWARAAGAGAGLGRALWTRLAFHTVLVLAASPLSPSGSAWSPGRLVQPRSRSCWLGGPQYAARGHQEAGHARSLVCGRGGAASHVGRSHSRCHDRECCQHLGVCQERPSLRGLGGHV